MSESDSKPAATEAKKDCKDCKWDNVPGCPIRRGLTEEEVGKKMDVCLANTLVKTGAGFAVGALFSLVLFKRRPWPIIAGTSFGFGLGVGNANTYMGGGGCHKGKRAGSCPIKKSTDADQTVAIEPVKSE